MAMAEIWRPIVPVTIRDPANPNSKIVVSGVVDTGSDISAISSTVVRQLGLVSTSQIPVTGVDCLRVSFRRYVVNLEFAGTRLERRAVVEWSGDEMIIGIDLLGEFIFTYDGKNHRFEIRDP